MNINTRFIENVVNSFHRSLLKDGLLCEFSSVTPDNANYNNQTYQKLYALKYYPAYYFEYSCLAEELQHRLSHARKSNIDILSLGSGLYPDYFSLEHNLSASFSYTGYDACNWPTTNLLPNTPRNINLINRSIDTLTTNDLSKYDVFIFPKSIGDIATSADIKMLGDKIAQTSKKTIYFLNSFIIRENINNNEQVSLFEKIHLSLINAGYTTTDDHKNTYHQGKENTALWRINNGFVYPSNISLCDNKDEECPHHCNVCHSPILTNKYMGYQLLEYNK